jgi:hypothetical protein
MANAALEHPAQFSAVTLDKALNQLVKAHLKGARHIKQNGEEILFQWRSMVTGNSAS